MKLLIRSFVVILVFSSCSSESEYKTRCSCAELNLQLIKENSNKSAFDEKNVRRTLACTKFSKKEQAKLENFSNDEAMKYALETIELMKDCRAFQEDTKISVDASVKALTIHVEDIDSSEEIKKILDDFKEQQKAILSKLFHT